MAGLYITIGNPLDDFVLALPLLFALAAFAIVAYQFKTRTRLALGWACLGVALAMPYVWLAHSDDVTFAHAVLGDYPGLLDAYWTASPLARKQFRENVGPRISPAGYLPVTKLNTWLRTQGYCSVQFTSVARCQPLPKGTEPAGLVLERFSRLSWDPIVFDEYTGSPK